MLLAKLSDQTKMLRIGPSSSYSTARLVITPPGGAERSVVLSVPQVRFGASAANDVVLADEHVSRFHFEIRKTSEGYLLRDLGSLNGTRVGDVDVKSCVLRSGAVISVGGTHIRFLADEGRPEEFLVGKSDSFGNLVGRSLRMREVFGVLERIVATDLTVLIGGETGSGKDVVARAIHAASSRADKPFVVFDCGAVAPSLIESELFGHVKGAFTGASESRDGAFVSAHGGTLFLDEIGELSLPLQPKLLRALEARTIRPVGGGQELPVDVRILAATHRDLEQSIKTGAIREDLFYRLSVVTIQIPALRERIDDLSILAETMAERRGKRIRLSPEVLSILEQYEWPGNVRELRNVIESAAAVCDGETIEPKHLVFFRPYRGTGGKGPSPEPSLAGKSLESLERTAIMQTLERCGGNKAQAARELGISTSTLYEKLKKYSG
jgi:transcriptional regulator with PAS, ATPase and Fis domain